MSDAAEYDGELSHPTFRADQIVLTILDGVESKLAEEHPKLSDKQREEIADEVDEAAFDIIANKLLEADNAE